MHFVLSLFLERIETIFALDYRSLLHEEFQLSERRKGLMSAPSCLNSYGRQDRSIRALETMLRIVHAVVDLDSIGDTRKQVVFSILIRIDLSELHKFEYIDVSDICTVLGQQLLNLKHNLRDNTPLCDILSLEGRVLS